MKLNKEQVEKVAQELAPIYALLNWRWEPTEGVPKAKDIAKTIHRLGRDIKGKVLCSRTGGLAIYKGEEGETSVEIRFELKSFDVEESKP